jgi:molecular chaperone GrpE
MSEPEPQADKVPPAEDDKAPRAPESGLAEALARAEEHREAWLRALADADNARKRAQAEIALARKFGAERVLEDLLPVMDSLEAGRPW